MTHITFANITADINACVKFETNFFFMVLHPLADQGFLVVDVSRSYSVRNTAFRRTSLEE